MYVLRKSNGHWFVRQADKGAGSGGGQAPQGGHGQETGPSNEGPSGDGGQQRNGDAPPASWDEVFQHDRFKQLVKRAKDAETALKKIDEERAAAEQAKLKEQSRFEELYAKEQQRAEKLAAELEETKAAAVMATKRRAIEDAARAHEPPFTAAAIGDVVLFVDMDRITVDDGKVKGVEAAIKELARAKPYMLEAKRQDPGSPAGKPNAGPARQSGQRRSTTL